MIGNFILISRMTFGYLFFVVYYFRCVYRCFFNHSLVERGE